MRALILAGLFVFLLQYSAAQTGPGGVGRSDGTSTLKLWFRSDNGVSATGSAINSWSNSAGIPALDISETGTERPALVTGAVNGFSEVSFNGTNRLRTGLTLTTSNFVTNAAASFVVVRADNTTQSSSIYLTDPLDVNRFSNHIPWSGSVYYDIGNCCGNEARLEVGGLTGLTGYSVWSYNATPASGKQVYRNGTLLQDRPLTSTYSSHATQRFNIGGNIAGSAGFAGDVTEIIIFNAGVNAAQRILIQNYLAAKYGLTLAAAIDVYTMDNGGNGNFDFDVAGIGRVDASNIHNDARGTGILRILNPTNLGNNEFFMWGHDNGDLDATNTSDIPAGVTARFDRVWRASETNEVGNLDLEFDLSGLAGLCDAPLELRLLIDTDDNNDFDDETPISGATNMGGNIYRFTGIDIEDAERFTLAIYYPAIEGPGGVGTGLQMWWRADAGVSTTAGLVTDWADQSGNGNNLVSPSGSRPATATSAAMNGQTVMRYSGAQYFTSAFSGPGVNNMTLFLTANGTNYQSLIRFQNSGGTYVVYPWETGRTFISSSDGGTGAGVASGLVNNVNNVGGARYRRNTTNGMQTYRNGAINAQRNSTNNVLPTQSFYSGMYSGGGEFPTCDVGEMIVYYTALNDAQMIIVQNYLAAKYNAALGSNDVYDGDDVANGNFDYDVAGIGMVNGANIHDDAKGTGIVRVFDPSGLNDGDFLMWGHDNGSLSALNTTDVPAGVQARMERVWSVTENGSVGAIDMQFDLTGLGPVTASDLRLLIDTDADGFSDGNTRVINGAIAVACNNYLFENVPSNSIRNEDRFTLGTTNLSQTPLPIELESFSGEIVEGDARLKWSTLSELNNHYFTIERSLNGKDFMTVGEVPGSGTTKLRTTYQYEDPFVPFGRLYYRLKQTDFDEAHSYSDIIMLENKAGEGTQLIAVPNPVSSGQTVNLRIRHTEQVDSKTVAVSVHDLLGRDIPVSVEADDQDQLQIRFSNTQASGIYIIRVRSPQLSGPLFTRVQLVK